MLDGEEYIQAKLEWAKCRLAILDVMEDKLQQMRGIAEYARDNLLSEFEIIEMNSRLRILGKEVNEIDDKSRIFWLENQ